MTMIPGQKILLSDLATIEAVLTADFVPGGTFTDIGAPIGRMNPRTAAVWEVTANIDLAQVAAASSILEVQLVAGGIVQPGELVAACIAGTNGQRYPATRTWRVSGLPIGWTVFSVQAKATGAGVWRMYQLHSHVLVWQVG